MECSFVARQNAKTLALGFLRCRGADKAKQIKVFCFFFSKKNFFSLVAPQTFAYRV